MAVPVLMLLVWPLARSSGRAQADRMRQLMGDLRHGRVRGYAIIAAVVTMIVISHLATPG
ncbi:MAG: hypothetical protein B7X57_00150 [Erythrobacter sp. 34-65-8]|nr:MAG: hypothetical protein B7X57_00150 [Erythrobacter sp. 34-65-8]